MGSLEATGEVDVMPIGVGECGASECADFIIATESLKPTATQREDLECALREVCLNAASCQMGSNQLDDMIERIPKDA